MKGRGWIPATREHPEAAGLGASLHHSSGWPVLSITGSPQTLELELVNRMPHAVVAGPAHLNLVFRPGVLLAPQDIVLAPQSEAAWSLSIHEDERRHNVSLAFAGVDRFILAPGAAITVRIDNVSADATGGSRATRVQLHYRAFFQASGVEAHGTRLLHLPVLRRHEPVGVPARVLRSGSAAEAGPFMAGFIGGADVLNDGKSTNTLHLRVVNQSGLPLPLAADGDAATRFFLSFRTGHDGAAWGLLGSIDDHLSIAIAQPGWQIDNHTLRRTEAGVWGPRESLDLELTLHTAAPSGDAQLVLSFENLPGHDDDDLVLLLHLGPMAARDDELVVVTPLALRGADARLSFDAEEADEGEAATVPVPSIAASRAAASVGRLDVDAPAGMRVDGVFEVTGALRGGANHPEFKPAPFKLGGDLDTYYPVVFRDNGWRDGRLRFEVFRADTHVDGQWRGTLMAAIECHSTAFGNGSDYLAIDVHQSFGETKRLFLANAENYPYDALHVLWLRGDTSYWWIANHPAAIVNTPDQLAQPDTITLGGGSTARQYSPTNALKPGFDSDYYARHWVTHFDGRGNSTRDAAPVPIGAIVLWAKATPVPLGWAVCDGSNGTLDLSAATLPSALGYIRKQGD
jgi:hypothetical protein